MTVLPLSSSVALAQPEVLSSERGTAVFVLRNVAIALLAGMTGLLFWSIAPAAVGWEPRVVLSGSMQPGVRPGDVVLVSRIAPEQLAPGQIVAFRDADRGGESVLHRVMSVDGDVVVTKGDANGSSDTAPVRRQDVDGIARLVVPSVGTPRIWAQDGAFDKLAVLLAVCLALTCLCTVGPRSRRH